MTDPMIEDYLEDERQIKASGTMTVRVTKSGGGSWYYKHIGETYRVYKKATEYHHGPGYRCVDIQGGITVADCEVAENAR